MESVIVICIIVVPQASLWWEDGRRPDHQAAGRWRQRRGDSPAAGQSVESGQSDRLALRAAWRNQKQKSQSARSGQEPKDGCQQCRLDEPSCSRSGQFQRSWFQQFRVCRTSQDAGFESSRCLFGFRQRRLINLKFIFNLHFLLKLISFCLGRQTELKMCSRPCWRIDVVSGEKN